MNQYNRQSFLGVNSERELAATRIAIIGLGGGGSHVNQQFAHIGIGEHVPVDFDRIELSNTTRLVGGTQQDVKKKERKTVIAERVIRELQPNAMVIPVPDKWQAATDLLKTCDLIVGAVDSFIERDELERFARRHHIPYIDIGMDVHKLPGGGSLISGQVILSTPGNPCLRCCGLVTDERLQQEANNYGDAGGNPQVIWPNGVLASTAVGLAVQLITPWHQNPTEFTYLEYDGNKGTISVSKRVKFLKGYVCPHHPADEVGDPFFDIRAHRKTADQTMSDHPVNWRSVIDWLKSMCMKMIGK